MVVISLVLKKIYASHPESILYCVDPWVDYEQYDEYKNMQNKIYDTFKENIKTAGIENKIREYRNFSHTIVPFFEDNSFNIIYVDANHEPSYTLEDCVLGFRKLKVGGYMIIDDYGWGGKDLTTRGIEAFVHAYYKRLEVAPHIKESQVFIKKLN